MVKYRSQILLAPILLVAFFLRIWGIDWGLPNTLHAVSYHPDETVLLLHSTTVVNPSGLNLFAGQFLPHFYNYGSLQLMLIDFFAGIFSVYSPDSHTASVGSTLQTIYLAGRLLTAGMGTLTVAGIWALGRRLYTDSAGLLAALLLAVCPLHAQHSHFMTVDVPATMWVVFALVWSARALTDDEPVRALAIGGLMAGLAAATKYNCALVLLPLVAAAMLRKATDKENALGNIAARVAAALFCAAAAFILGCPGSLFEHADFVRDVQFESRHVMSQQELWFRGTGNGWWYIASRNLDAGLGLVLLLAAGVGVICALYIRTDGDWLILVFALPYYLLVGAAVSRYARYEIPLLPLLCLFASRLLVAGATLKVTPIRFLSYFSAAFTTVVTACSCFMLLKPMSQVDPRDRAEMWIIANVDRTQKIGMATEPWFYSPPISRFFPLPGYGQWEQTPGGTFERSKLVYSRNSPFDLATLKSNPPSFAILSEYEYYDRIRLHDRATAAYLAFLQAAYKAPIVFADSHPLGGARKSAISHARICRRICFILRRPF